MNKQQVYSAWAPAKSIWSPWVKPVLFSHISMSTVDASLSPSDITWSGRAEGSTALVLDLPGLQSVQVGISLLDLGYRPVPLFNACPEGETDRAFVEVRPIMNALSSAALHLLQTRLPDDAPPVFMLDFNRGNGPRSPRPGMLDNRSISLPTDFPSANFLLNVGIKNVLLVQQSAVIPQADLSHTLLRWQEAGLPIRNKRLDQTDTPLPIVVQKPKAYRVLWYNLLATLGFRNNRLGGFGGVLPIPGMG